MLRTNQVRMKTFILKLYLDEMRRFSFLHTCNFRISVCCSACCSVIIETYFKNHQLLSNITACTVLSDHFLPFFCVLRGLFGSKKWPSMVCLSVWVVIFNQWKCMTTFVFWIVIRTMCCRLPFNAMVKYYFI